MNDYVIEECKRISYEFQNYDANKNNPLKSHSEYLDEAAKYLGFKHYTELRGSEPSTHVLSDQMIIKAKANVDYRGYKTPLHEHHDCIRAAYEWLDAQVKLKVSNSRIHQPIKHMVEAWLGRYVSTEDVIVAAFLHPKIKGHYPYFNISTRMTYPDRSRLKSFRIIDKHDSYDKYAPGGLSFDGAYYYQENTTEDFGLKLLK